MDVGGGEWAKGGEGGGTEGFIDASTINLTCILLTFKHESKKKLFFSNFIPFLN